MAESETPAGARKAISDHVGVRPTATLPDTETVVIILTSGGLLNQAHDVCRTLRQVLGEPLPENLLQFVWQPQQYPAGMLSAIVSGTFQNRLYFRVVDRRNYRRHERADRHTGRGQL